MSEEEPRERQPSERIREMARSLHEPKVGLLQRLADKIGMEKMEEFYQRTLELEAAGGMPTANGKRRRTAGGVLFQLTREILTPRERRKIFREKKPKPATPAQSAERKRAPQPPSSPALQPPTTEQVAAALKAAASIPAEKKGQAIMKVTVIGRPKQVKRMDTCVLVVLAPKAPGALPRGLPPVPEVTNATIAVFIANKQWTKAEAALKQDPSDELIVEGYPVNDPKNQITAVWAQSCTTKLLQRALRQSKTATEAEHPPADS
ncbi:MAG: hypothetical protein IPK16_27110 [Anaerolineales bacterium]|nr:hypothetical protein [Anaerolineales bacterium]